MANVALDAAPVLGAPLAEYLAEQIPRVAARSHSHYRYVPAEDYEQEMWLYALRRPERLKAPFDEGKLGLVRTRLYQAANELTRDDDRYRRALRAAEAGYSTEDLQFYSTGLIANLLPVLIEAEWDIGEAVRRAACGVDAAGVFIRNDDPFSGAENYQVMLIDLKNAFERLPGGMQRLLVTYYGLNQEDTEDGRWERESLASSMGLTINALRLRVSRALKRLRDELGGEDPWKGDKETGGQGPRSLS